MKYYRSSSHRKPSCIINLHPVNDSSKQTNGQISEFDHVDYNEQEHKHIYDMEQNTTTCAL
jgi:hypothetical protein